MTEYTRVTIQGTARKADLVLPDDEPVAAVLPEVLSLLDERTERSSRPVVLMTTVGEQLSSSLTLAEQEVRHGTLLRLVHLDEAPAPPEVADVTDVMADAVSSRPDSWRPVWGVLAAALAALVLGLSTTPVVVAAGLVPARLWPAVAVVLLGAVLLGRRGRTGPAVVLTALAAGAALTLAADVAQRLGMTAPGTTPLLWVGLVAVLVSTVAVLGFRAVPLALGGVVAGVLTGGAAVMHVAGMAPEHVAAVVACAGALALGVVPGLAMTMSGLSGLDDRVVEGRLVARADVEGAVTGTHRALTAATVAAVAPTAISTWALAGTDDVFARGVAAAVGVILLLRTQVLPLAPQRLALLAGGAVTLIALMLSGALGTGTLLLAAAAVLVALLVLTGTSPSENVRARLRRFAGVVELVAVVALVPLLLALLGVFGDLVETF